MSAPLNFRSALNGFNREDVVRYIEFISARHTDEVNQLNSQIAYLKSHATASDEAAVLNTRVETLLTQCTQQEEESVLAQLEVEEKLNAALARCAELEKQLEEARTAAGTSVHQSHLEQELEAYRRAERAERMAQERAEFTERTAKEAAERTRKQAEAYAKQLCDRANALLADATAKVDTAASQLSAMADGTLLQLTQLQAAVTESKKALRDTASSLYAISGNE